MSCKIITLAAVRLIPRPPARVDSKKIKIEGSSVNWSISCCLQTQVHLHLKGIEIRNMTIPHTHTKSKKLRNKPLALLCHIERNKYANYRHQF